MSKVVIVAIPQRDDYVWRISSEKIPHVTLLMLGEQDSVTRIQRIVDFVEHAAETSLTKFMLDVDRRGLLGKDDADVLFFNPNRSKSLREFRAALLQDDAISAAHNAVEQFEGWTPHLTLGYPKSPAKPDVRDYPGIYWLSFDRIAVWTDDFSGPTFELKAMDFSEVAMSDLTLGDLPDYAEHHGVKGMHWGQRKSAPERAANRVVRKDKRFEKQATSLGTYSKVHQKASDNFDRDVKNLNLGRQYRDAAIRGDLKKSFVPITAKYHKDVEDLFQKNLDDAAASMTNASNTRKYVIDPREGPWGSFRVKAADVEHSEPGELVITAIVDQNGLVTGMRIAAEELIQSDFVLDFLEHHGVKGMRWGHRKGAPSPVPSSVMKTKTGQIGKVSGGKHLPAHDDAVQARTAVRTIKKSGTDALSNDELRKLATRLQLETQVSVLSKDERTGLGKALIENFLVAPPAKK